DSNVEYLRANLNIKDTMAKENIPAPEPTR
ncbi:hypothetical protein Tco_0297614, partial [Tanacetum coccineum]